MLAPIGRRNAAHDSERRERRRRRPRLEGLEARIALSTIYSYDPGLGTIPDVQGWTRDQNPTFRGPEPIVSGGILHAFPQPTPLLQNWFQKSVSLDFATGSYVIQADLHVILSNYVGSGSAQRSGYYLWTVDSAGHSFAVGIDSAGITINTDGNFIPGRGVARKLFNTTDAFHTYRFVVDHAQGTLFIDGNQFASAPLGGTTGLDFTDPNYRNVVDFGDISGQGASETELKSLTFRTPANGDLVTTSLDWKTTQGGVDLGYEVKGGNLPIGSTIDFYWATGSNASDKIGTAPVLAVSVASTVGTYGPLFEGAAGLGPAPVGAKYLVAIPDIGGVASDAGALSVAFDPITAESATSPDSKGISFTYKISEDSLAQPFDVEVYRSASPTFDPATAIPEGKFLTIPTQDTNHADSGGLGEHTVVLKDPLMLHPSPP